MDSLPVDINLNVANAEAALRAWQRQHAAIKDITDALVRVNTVSRQARNEMGQFASSGSQAGKQIGAAFAGGIEQIKNFAAGITGIGSAMAAAHMAIAAIKREVEDWRQQQGKAATTQLTLAGAQRAAIANLGKDANLTPQKLAAAVSGIAGDTGASATNVYNAASTAFSFGGAGMSKERMLEAVRVAAEQTPDDDRTMQANVKAMLALMKRNKGISAKDAYGFGLSLKETSPTVTEEAFSSNVMPAVPMLQEFGDSPREAGALLSAMGGGIGDEEGRITANASIHLAKQLMEQPELANVKGGTMGRLRALQSDPKYAAVRKRLLGVFDREGKSKKKAGLTGEAKAFTTSVSFISGQGAASDLLNDTLKVTPEIQGAGRKVDELNQLLAPLELQQTAKLDRMLRQAGESLRAGDTKAGRMSISRERFDEILAASGTGAFERSVNALAFDTVGAGEDLGDAAERLRRTAKQRRMYAGDNNEERAVADKFEALAAKFDQMIALQQENNADQKQAIQNPEVPKDPVNAGLGRKK